MILHRDQRNQNPENFRRAFTRTDLLVSIAVLTVLMALVITPLLAAKKKAKLAHCTANLQQVNRAVLHYSEDNHQQLLAPTSGQPGDFWWWYKESVKRYVGLTSANSTPDTVFACPDDRGYSEPMPFHQTARFDSNSYVFNGVTLPGVPNIAGWQVTAVKQPRKTLLVMEWTAHAPLSWHKSQTGRNNAPFYCDAQSVTGFVDGHVQFIPIYYDGYNAAYTRDPIAGYEYQYSGN